MHLQKYKSLSKACHVPINLNIDVKVIFINIVDANNSYININVGENISYTILML
jgi:hypothetical protein